MTTSWTTRLLTAPIACVLAIALGTAAPASASSTTKKDPSNDVVLGDANRGIDLAAVQLKTQHRKKSIRVTFTLHSPVSAATLMKPGGMAVEFIKNKRIWRIVRVATTDGVLGSDVCSYSRSGEVIEPYDCSTLPVTQVDATTYRTVVELRQVKKGAKVLQWTAGSMDFSGGTPVVDSLTAKDRRPFRWRL